jgi:hypothetical protein
MRRLALVVLFVTAAVAGGVASCKQGEGERCQRQADCEGDLICVQSTGTCELSSAGADGNISPDARLDAGPADAEPADAAIDAAIDAAD